MNERIKAVRKANGLTQAEFGEQLGVKGNTVTNYETGLRTPSDAVILSICREFGVNETWLRTGAGDMLRPQSRDEELSDFLNDVLKDPPGSFRQRLVAVLSRLDAEEWTLLEQLAGALAEGTKKADP